MLGIDPGTRVVGYGAVAWVRGSARYVRCGVIRPKRGLEVPERLGAIRAGLDGVIARLRPKVVVVEEAFVARSVQSALRIGEGRGVALSCATVAGARIEQMPPSVAKKALTGNGGAHKEQVAAMVVRALNLPSVPQPDDATDALALALAWLQRRTPIPGSNAARVGVRTP